MQEKLYPRRVYPDRLRKMPHKTKLRSLSKIRKIKLRRKRQEKDFENIVKAMVNRAKERGVKGTQQSLDQIDEVKLY